MGRYCKILTAYDGSASSRTALRQAMQMADEEHSWVKVLAVVPSFEGELDLTGIKDVEAALKGPVEELLRSARDEIGGDRPNVIMNVEQGEAYETIVDVADREQCDLIVMGRRGLRRLERMLIGSVTARVIGHSTKDVLVVPLDTSLRFSDLVVAVDGSAHSQAALERALYFAAAHDARLEIVTVVDILPEHYGDAIAVVEELEKKSATILGDAAAAASSAGVDAGSNLLKGNPADEISRFAREKEAGMLFVGSRGHSGIRKMLLGSVAEKVIGLSASPVMVARAGTPEA